MNQPAPQSNNSQPEGIYSMDTQPGGTKTRLGKKPRMVLAVVAILLVGTATGYGVSSIAKTGNSGSGSQQGQGSEYVNSDTSAGIKDAETFPDKANGMLVEGGFEGEGSFHLERPGGESQNVYLTSSTVDLSQFLKKEVEVWGQTFASEKAGWLMDVGYIELK